MLTNFLYLFIGGGIGTLCRGAIAWLILTRYKPVFPMATLFSNILSCMVMALALLFLGDKLNSNTSLKLFLITGFCGGFSTFSSFSYETAELIKTGNTYYALANVLISVVLCVCIIYFFTKK